MSVVVLMIEHLGKVFLSTHPNHAIAWSTLLSYVNGTWAERFPTGRLQKTRKNASRCSSWGGGRVCHRGSGRRDRHDAALGKCLLVRD
jgi:hypothetical protein